MPRKTYRILFMPTGVVIGAAALLDFGAALTSGCTPS
jgi:hypothetical protein